MRIIPTVLSYTAYLTVLLLTSYIFYNVLFIWIAMSRFTAADGPPGDISITEKIIYSFVIPIGYFVVITLLSFVCRHYLLKYTIKLNIIIIFAITMAITTYLITQFYSLSFG